MLNSTDLPSVKFLKYQELEIKIQKGEFIVPLDTLRRTPVTKEELLYSSHRSHSQQERRMIEQV